MTAIPAATAAQAPAVLRHRRSARRLTAGQLADLRHAFAAAQALHDDRGFQHHAGIHGLPLPMYCTHSSPLFLPWHRAYLYFFERALQDRVAGVTLPWWDWTHGHAEGVPPAFARARADGVANPLARGPIQPSGRVPGGPARTVRDPGGAGAPPLPSPADLEAVLELDDFLDFSSQLEDIHNGVHVWVGGTMSAIATAAYDPLFWAHHAMIDRVWRLWQLRHPRGGPPAALLHRALPPFPATVADMLDSNALGYDYAAATASVAGPGMH
jgi:tyrosinase